jgi:hypothetical protein
VAVTQLAPGECAPQQEALLQEGAAS